MSKLIDKLSRLGGMVPKPIGFGTARQAEPKQAILLIASLAQVSSAEEATEIASSADAVIIEKTASISAIAELSRPLSRIPWGLMVENISQKEAKDFADAGCDFFVFTQDAPLDLPDIPKVGKILQVDNSLSEGMLRSVNELPLDATVMVAAAERKNRLTWRDLLFFQRAAELLAKPVLVTAPPKVSAVELQMLWKAGGDGLVLSIVDGQIARLKEMRQTIDRLTFPPRGRRKMEALLPRTSEEKGPTPAPEPEEEEEE